MRTRSRASAVAAGLVGVVALMGLAIAVPPAPAGAATTGVVQVTAVPRLAGVHFTLDGIPAVTGPGGIVTVSDPDLNGAAANVQLAKQQIGSNIRVTLDRVATDSNHQSNQRKLILELDATAAVNFAFYGPKGTSLPLANVQSVTLNNSLGEQRTLTASQLRAPVWLDSTRPAVVREGYENRVVAYSIKSVMDHGTNVVNTGQLRFTAYQSQSLSQSQSPPPSQPQKWSVPVILRSLTVVGSNLLTGGPAGSSVELTYPDGFRRTLSLGPHHRVTIANLPRGTYGVKVLGGAVPLSSNVRLSRNQTATEVVVTLGNIFEIFLIVAAVLAAVIAAGVYGRRRRHEQVLHPKGPTGVAVA